LHIDKGHSSKSTPMSNCRLATRVVDEEKAHGLGGGGEKVPAARERPIAHEPQISLVDEACGVERLASFFLG